MRKFAAAVTVMAIMALWLVTSSQGGGAGGRLPVGGQHVKKVSAKELRLAFARVMPWQWTMWVVKKPWSASVDRVCFSVNRLGPLFPVPGGGVQGPETGGEECGPIKRSRGVVVASPIGDGSVELPSGQTESWKAFDIGVAAYRPTVDQVRLVFSNGGSELLKTRAVPDAVAFKGTEPFRYVVFAVHGCVSKVEGLEKGRMVARVGPRDCSGSSE